jgi:hypothetical protein
MSASIAVESGGGEGEYLELINDPSESRGCKGLPGFFCLDAMTN